MIHRFKTVPTGETTCEVYIDEKKVRCRTIDVRYRLDEVPMVNIDLLGIPDLDIKADINAYSSTLIGNEQLLDIVAERFSQPEFLLELKNRLDKFANYE